jgi:hypothetical protein
MKATETGRDRQGCIGDDAVCGEVIIGDIGYRDHQVFTALGDAVNVAARLQDTTKGLECEVILSEEIYKTAGLPVNLLPEQELPIRGRAVPLTVRVVANALLWAAIRPPADYVLIPRSASQTLSKLWDRMLPPTVGGTVRASFRVVLGRAVDP